MRVRQMSVSRHALLFYRREQRLHQRLVVICRHRAKVEEDGPIRQAADHGKSTKSQAPGQDGLGAGVTGDADRE